MKAFTLIEAMACLLVIGSAMGLAAFRLQSVRSELHLEAGLTEIRRQDAMLREHSRSSGRSGRLTFFPSTGGVRWTQQLGEGLRESSSDHFPATSQVTAAMSSSNEPAGDSVHIDFAGGRAASYAVRVAAGGQQKWLIVSGLTGTFTVADDDSEIADIFTHLSGYDAR